MGSFYPSDVGHDSSNQERLNKAHPLYSARRRRPVSAWGFQQSHL